MTPSSSILDWAELKPKILGLLSASKSRKDVIEELSRDGSRIKKSQLEYQLKCWGWRTNLTEQGWRYANHKVQKRARNKKGSAVFFNGALIPHDKVVKETRRHDRPTLLPASGGKFDPEFFVERASLGKQLTLFATGSPKCPEGFDLVICTPPSSGNANGECRDVPAEVRHFFLDFTGTASPLPWLQFKHELRSKARLVFFKMFLRYPWILNASFPQAFKGSFEETLTSWELGESFKVGFLKVLTHRSSDLIMTTIPPDINVQDLTDVYQLAPFRSPITLNDLRTVKTSAFDADQLDGPSMTVWQRSESDQPMRHEAVSLGEHPRDSRIVTLLGDLVFQMASATLFFKSTVHWSSCYLLSFPTILQPLTHP